MASDRKVVVTCCVCKRGRTQTGRWVIRGHVPDEAMRSHTYCPLCVKEARQALLSYFEERKVEAS